MRRRGRGIALEASSLAALKPTGRIVVLIRGLCVSDLQWRRNEHDHGESLEQRLGFTPVYLFYNSGLHISENGRAASELLEAMVETWPVPIETRAIIGHSMGGLVARSACQQWRRLLEKLVCLGTPHHGAPLERIGAWINLVIANFPFATAFSRLGRIRSAGVTDLRHGSILDEDWRGHDRLSLGDARSHTVARRCRLLRNRRDHGCKVRRIK
jgi:pimeloyl-ACP methyl ester carboxylesterase